MSAMEEFVVIDRFPGIDDYRRLRSVSGMSPKSAEAAVLGLANTLFGVGVMLGERTVGRGRIIGDGGCFFIVVDIALQPEYQRRGLGKKIMDALDAWLRANAPESLWEALQPRRTQAEKASRRLVFGL
ncbi:MAG TPA: GNAT family N-acetyltransferase [Pseudoxanthomonas sp.]